MRKVLLLLSDELNQIFNLIPIFLSIGIIIYFYLPFEPNIIFPIIIFAGNICLLYLMRGNDILFKTFICSLALTIGFGIATLRTYTLDTYLLPQMTDTMFIGGEVEQIQHLYQGKRLIIKNVQAASLDPKVKRIRINVKSDILGLKIGDQISLYATLMPPPPPMVESGFNFARYSYFKQINAIGYATSRITIHDQPPKQSLWNVFAQLRNDVIVRLKASLPQPISGIAAGILVGDISSISAADYSIVRISGIAHLLAISGMHMVVVVAILFITTRFLILRSEYLTLRTNPKKIAALIALIGSFLYLLLALCPVSAERAFIMSTIVLLSILWDKNSTPLRAISIAAIIILIATPEEIMNPSLQMSFMASLALITSYTYFLKFVPTNNSHIAIKLISYFASILFSTLIAGLATAPFIIYHFHQYSTYSFITNLLAIPINDFWVMPLGLLALVLMPINLDYIPLQLMGYGIKAIFEIANVVSNLPNSSFNIANFSGLGIFLISISSILFMLAKTNLRYIFLITFILGFFLKNPNQNPDILIESKGKLFAVRGEDNELYYSLKSKARYIREIWQNQYGNQIPKTLKDMNIADCSSKFCKVSKNDHNVIIVNDNSKLDESFECNDKTLIVALFKEGNSPNVCKNILNLNDLKKLGNTAIWLEQGGIKMIGAFEKIDIRPWNLKIE